MPSNSAADSSPVVVTGSALPETTPDLPKPERPGYAESIRVDAQGFPEQDLTKGDYTLTCIDFCPDQVRVEEVDNIPGFLERHRPEWSAVRWINIDGLSNMEVLRAFAHKYELHPLAVEDILHPQRPKVEEYPASVEHPGRLYVVARMMRLVQGRLCGEQVSIFLGRKTLLTFQNVPGDVFDSLRSRLKTKGSRLRNGDASFLLYSIMDAIVDNFFPILEHYSKRLDDLEKVVLRRSGRLTLHQIHRIKRELLLLRRAAWPLRELLQNLLREPHECLSQTTHPYLRDVYDHVVQIIDFIETYRELASGLTETYMSVVSNRMNEIMKTLTIISTIFVPLTFLAGVYGMNMPIPENAYGLTYPIFWLFCLGVGGGMLVWFKFRGWF